MKEVFIDSRSRAIPSDVDVPKLTRVVLPCAFNSVVKRQITSR